MRTTRNSNKCVENHPDRHPKLIRFDQNFKIAGVSDELSGEQPWSTKIARHDLFGDDDNPPAPPAVAADNPPAPPPLPIGNPPEPPDLTVDESAAPTASATDNPPVPPAFGLDNTKIPTLPEMPPTGAISTGVDIPTPADANDEVNSNDEEGSDSDNTPIAQLAEEEGDDEDGKDDEENNEDGKDNEEDCDGIRTIML